MFDVGDGVRLVRHDQYPLLVGLVGRITQRAEKDGKIGDRAEVLRSQHSKDGPEAFYQVAFPLRVLYGVPESWLKATPLSRRAIHAPGRPWYHGLLKKLRSLASRKP